MNKTKKGFIIAAGVFGVLMAVVMFAMAFIFIAGSSMIIDLILELGVKAPLTTSLLLIYGIVLLIIAVMELVGAILLFVCAPNDKLRQGLYTTGAIFTIIFTSPLSIASILLYVSFCIHNETRQEPAVVIEEKEGN